MPPRKLWPLAILLGLLIPAKGVSGEVDVVLESLYDRLDPTGVSKAYHAVQEALETRRSHEVIHWRDSESGSFGMIILLRTFRIAGGHYCRQFHETVVTAENEVAGKRTACRDGAGIWLKVLE